MRLLLDTHTFLWWLIADSRLSRSAHELIADQHNEVYVSAASGWEIATKYRLGKLSSVAEVVNELAACIVSEGFKKLSISVEDANRAGLLPNIHRDPFDRMLVAQAKCYDLQLVTNDAAIRAFDIETTW